MYDITPNQVYPPGLWSALHPAIRPTGLVENATDQVQCGEFDPSDQILLSLRRVGIDGLYPRASRYYTRVGEAAETACIQGPTGTIDGTVRRKRRPVSTNLQGLWTGWSGSRECCPFRTASWHVPISTGQQKQYTRVSAAADPSILGSAPPGVFQLCCVYHTFFSTCFLVKFKIT